MTDLRGERNNFLITGFGRCGTKFLASALDQSPTWSVVHEPGGRDASLSQVVDRFARDKYGEVNSFVRGWLPLIPAKRKAIILRDPQELAVSVYNRHPAEAVERLHGVWELLDSHVLAGYQVFRFEAFTSDSRELERIGTWAGIDDLDLPPDVVSHPLNATRSRRVAQYGEIPASVRQQIDPDVSWFRRRYYR